jgi:hypothetical protein
MPGDSAKESVCFLFNPAGQCPDNPNSAIAAALKAIAGSPTSHAAEISVEAQHLQHLFSYRRSYARALRL